jgi:hypothetical protein
LAGYKKNYHLSIGHLAFSSVVFNFIKHPHFLQVWVFGLKNSQVWHIFKRYAANSSGDLGDPLIKSKGVTSIKPLYPIWIISPYNKTLQTFIWGISQIFGIFGISKHTRAYYRYHTYVVC